MGEKFLASQNGFAWTIPFKGALSSTVADDLIDTAAWRMNAKTLAEIGTPELVDALLKKMDGYYEVSFEEPLDKLKDAIEGFPPEQRADALRAVEEVKRTVETSVRDRIKELQRQVKESLNWALETARIAYPPDAGQPMNAAISGIVTRVSPGGAMAVDPASGAILWSEGRPIGNGACCWGAEICPNTGCTIDDGEYTCPDNDKWRERQEGGLSASVPSQRVLGRGVASERAQRESGGEVCPSDGARWHWCVP